MQNSSLVSNILRPVSSWENISRQYVNHPWEDEIFSPLCLILTWFSNYFQRIFINYLNYVLSFIFGIGIFFLHQRENNRSILSWKVHILAGNILHVSYLKFPAFLERMGSLFCLFHVWFSWEKFIHQKSGIQKIIWFCPQIFLRGDLLFSFFSEKRAKIPSFKRIGKLFSLELDTIWMENFTISVRKGHTGDQRSHPLKECIREIFRSEKFNWREIMLRKRLINISCQWTRTFDQNFEFWFPAFLERMRFLSHPCVSCSERGFQTSFARIFSHSFELFELFTFIQFLVSGFAFSHEKEKNRSHPLMEVHILAGKQN